MEQKSRFHIGFKSALVLAVMSLVSTTAAIVYFPWLLTSRKNVDSVIQEVNETITSVTSREVVRNFNNVQETLDLTKRVFNNQLIDLNNPQQREAFFFDLLAAQSSFKSMEFGFTNGSYFGVQREKDEQGKQTLVMNVINRIWDPQTQKTDKITVPYQRVGQQFLRQPTVRLIENYNATQRPWYKEAEKHPDKIAWTD
ncbi:MAG: hypothetical protein VKJ02_15210, partial [Snowella sp.]|nr:hypothetical protein [Snowella sp.]